MVPETAYPSSRDFKGQFSRWKYEAPGYPLTRDGQAQWLADFLAFCQGHPDIQAVYYWSPEWFGEGMWKAFALFTPDGEAQPAWAAFAESAWAGRTVKKTVYLDVCSNQYYVVPVDAAKTQVVARIRQLREQTGGVTVEHIALLTNTELCVSSYQVNLKASLQQNLSLTRIPGKTGAPLPDENQPESQEWADLVAGIDPTNEQVVLILRDTTSPAVQQAIRQLEQKRIRVLLHPIPDNAPLKFGMCGAFAE